MISTVLLGTFGGSEIFLIIFAIVLLFGGKKIPELMKGVGEGIREFKKAANNTDTKNDNGK